MSPRFPKFGRRSLGLGRPRGGSSLLRESSILSAIGWNPTSSPEEGSSQVTGSARDAQVPRRLGNYIHDQQSRIDCACAARSPTYNQGTDKLKLFITI